MNIQRIDTETTQKIGSSQVVVSMAAAIKELIENSLDAHANKIEIRLKNFGADLIEVHDNGTGITCKEFHQITKRHTTSKIENFNDLSDLQSFGFRGEALNSLCFLGDVQIHTATQSSSVGTLLTFDSFGRITESSPNARQRGTTVYIRNIFHSLPVRRKQLMANLKKEFDKAMKYITGYCLICDNVQLSCFKIDKSKKFVIGTTGSSSIRGNIEAIFGVNQMKDMIEIITKQDISPEIVEEFNVKEFDFLKKIKLFGWLSRPSDNSTCGNTNKQFLYINKRPCELPKIKKLILECYRIIMKSQIPVFVIHIVLPQDSVDINIEPDKRVMFLDNQSTILAVIKASVLASFCNCGFSPLSRTLDTSFEASTQTFIQNFPDSNKLDDELKNCSQSSLQPSKRSYRKSEESISKYPKINDFTECRGYKSQVATNYVKANFSLSLLNEMKLIPEANVQSTLEKYQLNLSSKDDEKAEDELKKMFHKHYFNDLEVIGQFNKGFIIAKKNFDLFIIDQHASDERKQFEKLLDECKVTSQPLACPQKLHLTAGDEEIIVENLTFFNKWGFRFEIKESDELHRCVLLTATPCRKNLTLGVKDIEELIEMIKESGSSYSLMPSRVRSAIASNACRSAVMIGKSLSMTEMKQILKNMSVLKDPWSCAHGRPTMRHLFCLETS